MNEAKRPLAPARRRRLLWFGAGCSVAVAALALAVALGVFAQTEDPVSVRANAVVWVRSQAVPRSPDLSELPLPQEFRALATDGRVRVRSWGTDQLEVVFLTGIQLDSSQGYVFMSSGDPLEQPDGNGNTVMTSTPLGQPGWFYIEANT
jgi:hypothetical protein